MHRTQMRRFVQSTYKQETENGGNDSTSWEVRHKHLKFGQGMALQLLEVLSDKIGPKDKIQQSCKPRDFPYSFRCAG